MASIRKLPNGVWQVRWRERPGGPQTAKNFKLKRDGVRFMTGVEADLQRGVYVDPTLGDVSLVEAMEEYIGQQPYRHNTGVNARYALEHVRRHFGDRQIGRVRTSDLQEFVTSLELEPRTVASIWQYVRSTLRAAYLDGVIGRDPTQRVKLPLRHHYASSLISTGCSIVAVQRALGHAKPSITLDMYGHLMPSDEDRIRSAIDVAWSAEDGLRTPAAVLAL